jgi:hypothetical protein
VKEIKKYPRKMKDNFQKTDKLVGLMLMDADLTEEI